VKLLFVDVQRPDDFEEAFARIASAYPNGQFVAAGELVSLGTNFPEAIRQAGDYPGRVLNGEKPENLPVMQVTKIDLVINMKTAKALGLTIPPTLLARADEVIE
jgi:putative tryptophan/tyrosine transport system substrate-binding protein